MNHYASNMLEDMAGRHYWFAENLIAQGYDVTIFCANTIHNSTKIIEIEDGLFKVIVKNNIKFVFVKTTPYKDNGKERIKNMIYFYKNLFAVSKAYSKMSEPDVIISSSVHPLTLVAGIKIAKKFKISCVCEVRDLWPESLIAYGVLKRNSIIAKILYQGEKWIYKNADRIIMTWEGGKDYIANQGWNHEIDLSKVYHINNGVVIEAFDENSEKYRLEDVDIKNSKYKNIVYAGSIRKVNNLGVLIDSAKIIQEQGIEDIRFLIYGSGDEKEKLEQRCKVENIKNVIFKGRIEKKYIPYILKNAYINILHNSSTSLDKYGQSQNKFFEYLAAGRCIVQTYATGYSICSKYDCGVSVSIQNPQNIANTIVNVCSEPKKNEVMGRNARNAAYEYDFKQLTQKLIEIIEDI